MKKRMFFLFLFLMIGLLSMTSCRYIMQIKEKNDLNKLYREYRNIPDTLPEQSIEKMKEDIIWKIYEIQCDTKSYEIAERAGSEIRSISGFVPNKHSYSVYDGGHTGWTQSPEVITVYDIVCTGYGDVYYRFNYEFSVSYLASDDLEKVRRKYFEEMN